MKNFHKGFTLIEVMIYIALLAIIFGGAGAAVFGIMQNSARLKAAAFVQDEGEFILGKLDWALGGASGFSLTAMPPSLTINKFTGGPVVFDLDGTDLRLRQESGSPLVLNADDIRVSNLVLADLPSQNGRPEGLDIKFTLQTTTMSGAQILQDFTLLKFLRK